MTLLGQGSIWALGLALLASAGCGSTGPSAYVAQPLDGTLRIAVLPLANYSRTREAATRLMPLISTELVAQGLVTVVDLGEVEEALADEPWIMSDRIPPDLVDSLGVKMNADALLLGAILEYGFRESEGRQVPQVSIALRLLASPGGRILWSVVHSRDGTDHESVFGLGRTESLQALAMETVREMMKTFPPTDLSADEDANPGAEGEESP